MKENNKKVPIYNWAGALRESVSGDIKFKLKPSEWKEINQTESQRTSTSDKNKQKKSCLKTLGQERLLKM